MKEEQVVIVDEENNVLRTMPKSVVHGADTPLHRAFSSFIFNKKGELLIQRRGHEKKAWPLVWSNSCCGHPTLNEDNVAAAKRRLKEELGLSVSKLEEVMPYRYKFSQNGIMENEICPVLVGITYGEPQINPDEVEEIRWINWEDFLKETDSRPGKYSPWCLEQAKILQNNKRFQEIMNNSKGKK